MVTVDYIMESFLPSEVARLVYGYLEDEGCKDAACEFLNKSSNLKECLLVASKGRKFNSKFYGMNLIDLLELLTEAVSFANERRKELKLYKAEKKYSLLIPFVLENLSSDSNDEGVESGDTKLKSYDSTISVLPTSKAAQPKKKERVSNGTLIKPNRKSEGQNPDNVDIATEVKIKEENTNGQNPDNVDIATEVKIKEENTNGQNPDNVDIATEVKIKEENTNGECDVEGSGVSELELTGSQTTGNVAHGPVLVKREPQAAQPQLVCQPYPSTAVLQLVPAGPPVYFPQQQLLSLQHQPSLPPSIYQTTNANSVQSVWTNTKTSSTQLSNNRVTVRSSTNNTTQSASSNSKSSSSQQCNRSKLRPIAPKITQPLDNGVNIQILHNKNKALVESTTNTLSRTLRPRKKRKVLHSVCQSTPNLNLTSQLT